MQRLRAILGDTPEGSDPLQVVATYVVETDWTQIVGLAACLYERTAPEDGCARLDRSDVIEVVGNHDPTTIPGSDLRSGAAPRVQPAALEMGR